MYGGLFKVKAKPGKKAELLAFFMWDAEFAKKSEPGTLRFDVWEDPNESDSVFLYEAYSSPEAFTEHRNNAPFKKWQAEVLPQLVMDITRLVPFTNSAVSIND